MKRAPRLVLAAAAIILPIGGLIVVPVTAVEKTLPSRELVQALVNEVSGEIAFGYTAQISRFDRVQASIGWHDAAVWIKSELERIGYTDATIEGWPSNGTTRYYTYRTPIGWRAKKAELWLVSPRRERLCFFDEMPLTLIKHSGTAHVEAELVDVGAGDAEGAYRGRDVKGKIVLATGAPGAVSREAIQNRGAVGMVGWYTPDVRPGYPNMVRYTAFWPAWEDRTTVGFGFNVSKLQGWTLKQMLEQGTRVVLRADVESEFHDTKVEVLSASLQGSEEPQKELLLIGHLCHPMPSANDNGSGSGGMLEMARALKRMVDTGAITRPRRTIRFLWVPEFAGTVPYIKAHLDRVRNTLAVINCDMIGEHLARTGGMFTITQTPDSLPTTLNDVAVHFARVVEGLGLKSINGSDLPFAWRAAPYSGGSDHVDFNDGAVKVPALMFGHGDTFHHTSLDTMDKVDASELRRVSTIALGTMIYLASAADLEALDMARLVARNGIGRLSENYHDSLPPLLGAATIEALQAAYRQLQNVVRQAAWREGEAIRSARLFASSPRASEDIGAIAALLDPVVGLFAVDGSRQYVERVATLGQAAPPAGKPGTRPAASPVVLPQTSAEQARSLVVPVRASDFICPLDESYLDEKLGAGTARGLTLRGNVAYEALNFADGKRSVTEIARAVSAEYGPAAVDDVYAYFAVLERAGLMKLSVAPPARRSPAAGLPSTSLRPGKPHATY